MSRRSSSSSRLQVGEGPRFPGAGPAAAVRPRRRRSIGWSCRPSVRSYRRLKAIHRGFRHVSIAVMTGSSREDGNCFPFDAAMLGFSSKLHDSALGSSRGQKKPRRRAGVSERSRGRDSVSSSGSPAASGGPRASEPGAAHSSRHIPRRNRRGRRHRSADRTPAPMTA